MAKTRYTIYGNPHGKYRVAVSQNYKTKSRAKKVLKGIIWGNEHGDRQDFIKNPRIKKVRVGDWMY
jgi:hypothetical protein